MSTIKIKRSGTSSQTPSSLEHGELALNYADGKLFYKDATDTITELSTGGGAGGLDSAGVQSVFDNQDSIRLGDNTTTVSPRTITVGVGASTSGSESMAIGQHSSTSGLFALALGRSANASYEDAIAIGRSATSSQADTIAMGTSSVASGSRSVAIGNATDATGADGVAIGNTAQALAGHAIAIGSTADTNANTYSIAIGSATEVTGSQGIAIGQTAAASQASVAIGSNASVTTGTESTAIGPFAGATGNGSLALGRGAKANANNTIALAATGATSTVATQYGIDIRTSDSGSVTYSTDSDWVFGAPVTSSEFKFTDGTSMTTAPTGGAGGGLDSAAVIATMNEEFKITTNQVEIGSGASATNGAPVAIGRDALAKWSYAVAIGRGAEAGNNSKTADVAIGFQAIANGSESIAIGRDALANQYNSLSIGNDAEAQGVSSIAIGKDAKNALFADYSIVMGENTVINNSKSIALNASGSPLTVSGLNSIDIRTSAAGSLTYNTTDDWKFGAQVTAPEFKFSDGTSMTTAPTGGAGGGLDSAGVQSVFDNQQSIRLGEGATTQDTSGEVAIGYLADATGAQAIAIGYDANATALFTLSLGRGSNATAEDAIAIGRSATSSQADTIAMGTSSVASGSRSVAIGNATDATGADGVAIGNTAQALAGHAIAIGSTADTNANTYSIAIGSATEVTGSQGIAIGQTAAASQASVAIGSNASVTTGTESTAIGPFAGATGNGSLALGRGAKANANNTIALAATGATSTVATQYGIDIRTSDSGSVTYSTDSDWVFGAPVTSSEFKFTDGTSMTTAPTGGAGGGLDSAAVIATMNEEFKITTNQVEIGSGASATNGAPVAIGRDALAKWSYAVAIGRGAEAGNNSKTADVAIGFQAIANGSESIAIGRDALANQYNSLSIGNDAEAQGVSSIAIGKDAKNALFADYSIVMGENTVINNSKSIALNASGSPLTVSGLNSIDIRTSAAGSLTYNTTDDWKFGAQVSAPELTVDAATSDWKFSVSGDDLIISFGGTSKAKLDTSGNLTVVGDVTAFGTI